MSIVGAFPTVIKNGDNEDATVVMSLFTFLQAQVNGNACPATSGTAILKGNGSGGTQPAVSGTDYLGVQPGMLFDYAGTSAPAGYLLCDGSAVSRTTYSALFSAIGTTWGAGDGSTTFNVPDLRRRATIGSGGTQVSGPGTAVGNVGGEEKHVIAVSELPSHNHGISISDPGHVHSVNDSGHAHTYNAPQPTQSNGGALGYAASPAATATTTAFTGISLNSASTGITAGSALVGGGVAANVMQPSAVVTKIIKV